jgi:hypothetical protein
MHRATLRLRPHEAAIFQSLREQAKTVTIPPQQFYPIAASATKDKELARVWMFG